MRIATFSGPDLATALERAAAAFGPDAAVLSTSERDGQIEIAVAVRGRASETERDHLRRVAREVERLRTAPAPAPRPAPTRSATVARVDSAATGAAHAPLPPGLQRTAEALVRAGLTPDLVARFARIAARDLRPGFDAAALAEAATRGVGGVIDFAPPPRHTRALLLVGPPGAGKTTTAAKLAARLALEGGRPVVIADADAERVGAFEQSRIFARHLGVGLEPVPDPQALQAARRRHPDAALVIDTAGVGRADRGRLRDIDVLRRGMPDADVVLVVPAGVHREEAGAIVERFRPLRPTYAAISKVDDGGRIGDVVSALAPERLSLSFVTNGYRVPDDLEDASPRGLAALLLRAGSTGRGAESFV